MKVKAKIGCTILLYLFILACEPTRPDPWQELDIQTVDQLIPHFENPPTSYRTAPFWVWHDRVQKERIDRDLTDLKEQGFGGVFMHPRYGIITEYLSDEWFDLIQHAVKKTKSLGMQAWIYDENSFPSGFAGGHVPDQMPDSYQHGQGLVQEKFSTLPTDVDEKFFIVLEKSEKGFKVVADPKPGLEGDFRTFSKVSYGQSKWHAGFSYVDLIYPGVTEKFIDVTMTGYEKSIGSEFGKAVPGVFTDEPNIATPSRESIRWTPDLFDRFQERWGYELKVNLPSLFAEVGHWKKVRHDHYCLLLELFIERWSKPWFEYTEEHNLKWTGHYWEHGWPSPHHGGDNMAMYAWHQVPAIDMLFNTMDQNDTQFGNIRAVKELRSIANQMGRKRTLSETYGAAGWELRFEDMKRLGDWEYVMGVNFMNQHLTYMTLIGDRKHDFPQSFSYHDPWWHLYKHQAEYFARLSVAMASGEQNNRILVIEPTSTTWMYYSPTHTNKKLNQIGDSFHTFLAELENHQIEYDLGCENTIKNHGSSSDGKLIIGQRAYDFVLLPPEYEVMESWTADLLATFIETGGRILSFSNKPLMRADVDGFKADQMKVQKAVSLSKVIHQLSESDFKIADPLRISGQLFHHRRRFSDGQLLFLVNSSLEEASTASISMEGASVIQLDAMTGKVAGYPAITTQGSVSFEINIQPAGSLLLFVFETEKQFPIPDKPKSDKIIPSDPSEIERVEPNVQTLDYCDLSLADTMHQDIYFYSGGFKIWQAHGYPDNPWVSSSQFKTEWVDADTFAEGTGFTARFPFMVEEAVDFSSLQAVVEQPWRWTVSVNGNEIQPVEGEWWLDEDFGVFNIGPIIRPGENDVTIAVTPMSIFAEIEPVYIIGNFSLKSGDRGWIMVPAALKQQFGAWKDQGLPFYSDGVAYKKTVRILKDQKVKVKLGKWSGSAVEVRVNGEYGGFIGWQPYELDISDRIQTGTNRIEVIVYGSLKNVLGPHHHVRRRGIVTPWSFKYAPDVQPAGAEYDLDGYGLFEDFEVIAF